MNRRRFSALSVTWIWAALLIGACNALATPTPVKEPLDLTILHTGHVYGEILPCG